MLIHCLKKNWLVSHNASIDSAWSVADISAWSVTDISAWSVTDISAGVKLDYDSSNYVQLNWPLINLPMGQMAEAFSSDHLDKIVTIWTRWSSNCSNDSAWTQPPFVMSDHIILALMGTDHIYFLHWSNVFHCNVLFVLLVYTIQILIRHICYFLQFSHTVGQQ